MCLLVVATLYSVDTELTKTLAEMKNEVVQFTLASRLKFGAVRRRKFCRKSDNLDHEKRSRVTL